MNFLHNQQIMEIIIFSLVCLGAITIMYGFITLITLMRQVRIRLKTKTQIELTKLVEPKDISLPTNEQIELTRDFMNLINELIKIESDSKLKTYAPLNKKYEYTMLADDIEEISGSVYDGLKKDLAFNNPNVFVSDDYLMKYIAQQSSIIFMGLVIQYNSKYVVTGNLADSE